MSFLFASSSTNGKASGEKSSKGSAAYGDKTGNAGPQGVVGQLFPASLVHDGALVNASSDDVDEHCYQDDDAEDTRGPELLFCGFNAAASGRGAGFEDVGA